MEAVDHRVMSYDEALGRARAVDPPARVRLIGVDGCGGAGKTTFAARLAAAAGAAPVVHTDDFASWDEPMQWWPRFLTVVIEPLLRGEPTSYHPYNWVTRGPDPALVTVPPAPIVVVEGVGATRAAWRDRLALRIWIETPRDVRLARGLARDGESLRDFWTQWMAAEDRYLAAEHPDEHADLVIDGTASTSSGFVVVKDRRVTRASRARD